MFHPGFNTVLTLYDGGGSSPPPDPLGPPWLYGVLYALAAASASLESVWNIENEGN